MVSTNGEAVSTWPSLCDSKLRFGICRDTANLRAVLPNYGRGYDGSPGGDVNLPGRGRGRQPVRRGAAIETPLATVIRKIFELESHLRTKLFNRSSRNLVLTDAGSSYLESTICPKSSWAGAVSGRPRCFENAEFRQRRSLYRSIEISKRPVDKATGNFNRAARSSRSDCRKALSLRSNLASSSPTARMKCSRGILAIQSA
jgi:hypothetical protein